MEALFLSVNKGARFTKCRKHRLYLWRIWDANQPLAMFIGLNPSTANSETDDPTICRVQQIAKSNGFGGIYMTNLFTYISTDPRQLDMILGNHQTSDQILKWVANQCSAIVFAWGNFKVLGRDNQVKILFPSAYALTINKNGSPKHPLYCRADTKFVNYNTFTQLT